MSFPIIFSAFAKAGRDLLTPSVLWRALVPPLVSLLLWVTLAVVFWRRGIALVEPLLPSLPWAGWEWLAQWAAGFLLLLSFAALFYVTTLLIVAVFLLPGLITLIAARDYPDLQRHGENVFWGSLWAGLSATLIYVVAVLLTLPLLLIPGVVLFLPLGLNAWVSQRTFRYDALAEHATASELQQLVRQHRGSFFAAGLGCGVLAYVPILNLVIPVFTALVFVHFGLQRLRELRQQQGVQL